MGRRTSKKIRNVKRRTRALKKDKAKWKIDLKKEMKIKKLMLETQDHDHEKCDCEGCYWWCMTKTIWKNGRLFYIIPSWKDFDRDEYLRVMQRELQYRMDKRLPPEQLTEYLMKKTGVPKKRAKAMAEQMLAPVFMVMYGKSPSPAGLLRDV